MFTHYSHNIPQHNTHSQKMHIITWYISRRYYLSRFLKDLKKKKYNTLMVIITLNKRRKEKKINPNPLIL